MASVILKHINKVYPNKVQAVFDFNLEIKDQEFIVFVGPSGCGKSTTLRMIAGLEDITSGEVYIDGVLSNNLLPKDRDIAMVFQSYALYPHMSVAANMGFGLKMRKYKKEEINERVLEAAKILELENYLDRKPRELSGGQRQRVALGRAIVRNAKIFLMDEPLSNLDAKLRVQMRSEIIKLHETLKTTTIYVTHDQTEAMTMATRIVVMNKGYVQQIGTPKEIYNHPYNKFVATFVGSPSMNLINVKYENHELIFDNGYKMHVDKNYDEILEQFYDKEIKEEQDWIDENINIGNKVLLEPRIKEKEALIENLKEAKLNKNHQFILGIRPEGIRATKEKDDNLFEKKVLVSELLGSEYYLHFNFTENSKLVVKASADESYSINEKVYLEFIKDKITIFDPVTEKNIE